MDNCELIHWMFIIEWINHGIDGIGLMLVDTWDVDMEDNGIIRWIEHTASPCMYVDSV